MWLLNLPSDVRNKPEIVGSSIVGYLPVVRHVVLCHQSLKADFPTQIDEQVPKSTRSTAAFRTAKHIMYHDSFREILRAVRELAHSGISIACGDGQTRKCYLAIGCISADLLEQ